MKPMAKPDTHPDADLLNAFAEHALTEPERARVMAHMADCSRCREVVFLAHAAAESEAPAERWAVVKPETRPGRLATAFARWRIALIPAAALATAGATVLWFQLRPVTMDKQVAKETPPPPPAASRMAPPTPAAAKSSPDRTQDQSIAPRAAAPVLEKSTVPGQPDREQKKIPANAGLMTFDEIASGTSQAASKGRDTSSSAIHLDGRSAAMARYSAPQPVRTFPAPAPFPSPRPEQATELSRQMDARLPVPTTAASASAAESAIVSGASAPFAATTAVSGEPAQAASTAAAETELDPQQLHGLAVMRLVPRVKLPNGLNSVSSAVVLNRMVAVDSAGGLFSSQDGGMHWTVVPASWSGKAVEVKAATPGAAQGFFALTSSTPQSPELKAVSGPPPAKDASAENRPPAAPPPPAAASSTPAMARAKAKAQPAPPVVPLLFRLVTDRHEVWLSADGKAWRRQ